MSTFYERPLRSDELYHYGRLGMKWGRHIFGVAKGVGTLTDVGRELLSPSRPGAVSGNLFAKNLTYGAPKKKKLGRRISDLLLDGEEFFEKHSSTTYSYVNSLSKFADINREKEKYRGNKETPSWTPTNSYSRFVNDFYSASTKMNDAIRRSSKTLNGWDSPKTTYSTFAKTPQNHSSQWYAERRKKVHDAFSKSLDDIFGTNVSDLR